MIEGVKLDYNLGEWRDVSFCRIAIAQDHSGLEWHLLGEFSFQEVRKIETFRSREEAGAAYWAIVALSSTYEQISKERVEKATGEKNGK